MEEVNCEKCIYCSVCKKRREVREKRRQILIEKERLRIEEEIRKGNTYDTFL